MSSPLHRKANKSLDINLIVEGVFYSTVLKNCWSILNLKNPKDLFTGRKLELSLNLFKQAIKTALALSCGKTIMLWAPPPHHRRVKSPSVHHQNGVDGLHFLKLSLTYFELVITGSEFTVNLCPPGPCPTKKSVTNLFLRSPYHNPKACWFVFKIRCRVFKVNYCFTYNPMVIHCLTAI